MLTLGYLKVITEEGVNPSCFLIFFIDVISSECNAVLVKRKTICKIKKNCLKFNLLLRVYL